MKRELISLEKRRKDLFKLILSGWGTDKGELEDALVKLETRVLPYHTLDDIDRKSRRTGMDTDFEVASSNSGVKYKDIEDLLKEYTSAMHEFAIGDGPIGKDLREISDFDHLAAERYFLKEDIYVLFQGFMFLNNYLSMIGGDPPKNLRNMRNAFANYVVGIIGFVDSAYQFNELERRESLSTQPDRDAKVKTYPEIIGEYWRQLGLLDERQQRADTHFNLCNTSGDSDIWNICRLDLVSKSNDLMMRTLKHFLEFAYYVGDRGLSKEDEQMIRFSAIRYISLLPWILEKYKGDIPEGMGLPEPTLSYFKDKLPY